MQAASARCWCIPARPCTVFEDDRTYPFEVHAPFKVWVPLADAPDSFMYFEPGHGRRLLFHSRRTTGTSPPRCRKRIGRVTSTFGRSPTARRARDACPRSEHARPTSVMPSGACALGSGGGQSAGTVRRLDFPRAAKTRTSSTACARRAGSARWATPPRRARSRRAPASLRSSWRSCARAACASRSCRTTPSSR